MSYPNNKLYLCLLIAAVAITFAPFRIPLDSQWFAIVTGVGCGGIASVIVAWLIDFANCKQKNNENVQKLEMIFANYRDTVDRLQEYVALKGKYLIGKEKTLTFSEWLNVMLEIPNERIDNKEADRSRIYKTLLNYIMRVKESIVLLQQQYALLVGLGVVKTTKLQEHLLHQYVACESVADSIISETFARVDCELANEALEDLVDTFRTYFPDCKIPEKYNYEMLK